MATRRFPSKTPASAREPDDDKALLPFSLRTVLYSPQKLEILTILERDGTGTTVQIMEQLTQQIQRNSVNLHIKDLVELGWIAVERVEQVRGGFARVFVLSDPTFSWTAFLHVIRKAAPTPVPPDPSNETTNE